MLAAVVGVEDDTVLGPCDSRVVDLEPGHAENDWIVAEARDAELHVLCVRSDRKTDRESFVRDGARRDRAPIDDFHTSWRIAGTEADVLGLSESKIDKGKRGAAVDHDG